MKNFVCNSKELFLNNIDFEKFLNTANIIDLQNYIDCCDNSIQLEPGAPFYEQHNERVNLLKKYGSEKNIPENILKDIKEKFIVENNIVHEIYCRAGSCREKIIYLNNIEEKKQAEKIKAEKKQYLNTAYHGYLKNKTPFQAAKIDNILKKNCRLFTAEHTFTMHSKADAIEICILLGSEPVQNEYINKNLNKSIEYFIDTTKNDNFILSMNKTEYNYSMYLKKLKDNNEL